MPKKLLCQCHPRNKDSDTGGAGIYILMSMHMIMLNILDVGLIFVACFVTNYL